MKIYLYYIGRPKDAHANALAEDFLGRASRFAPCEMREIDPTRPGRSGDIWTRHPTGRKILLDPGGKPLDSAAFSRLIADAEMQGRDLIFVIGGHDGLPAEWRPRADLLLSLSAMTFPHELARAMLAEQIYRAFAILRNLPYVR